MKSTPVGSVLRARYAAVNGLTILEWTLWIVALACMLTGLGAPFGKGWIDYVVRASARVSFAMLAAHGAWLVRRRDRRIVPVSIALAAIAIIPPVVLGSVPWLRATVCLIGLALLRRGWRAFAAGKPTRQSIAHRR